jgi:hypothetical protein
MTMFLFILYKETKKLKSLLENALARSVGAVYEVTESPRQPTTLNMIFSIWLCLVLLPPYHAQD